MVDDHIIIILINLINFLVPSVSRDAIAEPINETAVKLSWSTPETPNGIILEYQIIYYGYKSTLEEKVIDYPPCM